MVPDRVRKMAFELSILLARKSHMLKEETKARKTELTHDEIRRLAKIHQIISHAAEQLQGVR